MLSLFRLQLALSAALAAAVVSGPACTNSAALYAHSGYQLNTQAPMAFYTHRKPNGEKCKVNDDCRSSLTGRARTDRPDPRRAPSRVVVGGSLPSPATSLVCI